jgi:hypothetical protein
VPGPDNLFLPAFGCLLAYGPAPGIELIPYFLGLLAWAGLAFSAIFLSPILALLRRFRKTKGVAPPESTGDGSPDRV